MVAFFVIENQTRFEPGKRVRLQARGGRKNAGEGFKHERAQ